MGSEKYCKQEITAGPQNDGNQQMRGLVNPQGDVSKRRGDRDVAKMCMERS